MVCAFFDAHLLHTWRSGAALFAAACDGCDEAFRSVRHAGMEAFVDSQLRAVLADCTGFAGAAGAQTCVVELRHFLATQWHIVLRQQATVVLHPQVEGQDDASPYPQPILPYSQTRSPTALRVRGSQVLQSLGAWLMERATVYGRMHAENETRNEELAAIRLRELDDLEKHLGELGASQQELLHTLKALDTASNSDDDDGDGDAERRDSGGRNGGRKRRVERRGAAAAALVDGLEAALSSTTRTVKRGSKSGQGKFLRPLRRSQAGGGLSDDDDDDDDIESDSGGSSSSSDDDDDDDNEGEQGEEERGAEHVSLAAVEAKVRELQRQVKKVRARQVAWQQEKVQQRLKAQKQEALQAAETPTVTASSQKQKQSSESGHAAPGVAAVDMGHGTAPLVRFLRAWVASEEEFTTTVVGNCEVFDLAAVEELTQAPKNTRTPWAIAEGTSITNARAAVNRMHSGLSVTTGASDDSEDDDNMAVRSKQWGRHEVQDSEELDTDDDDGDDSEGLDSGGGGGGGKSKRLGARLRSRVGRATPDQSDDGDDGDDGVVGRGRGGKGKATRGKANRTQKRGGSKRAPAAASLSQRQQQQQQQQQRNKSSKQRERSRKHARRKQQQRPALEPDVAGAIFGLQREAHDAAATLCRRLQACAGPLVALAESLDLQVGTGDADGVLQLVYKCQPLVLQLCSAGAAFARAVAVMAANVHLSDDAWNSAVGGGAGGSVDETSVLLSVWAALLIRRPPLCPSFAEVRHLLVSRLKRLHMCFSRLSYGLYKLEGSAHVHRRLNEGDAEVEEAWSNASALLCDLLSLARTTTAEIARRRAAAAKVMLARLRAGAGAQGGATTIAARAGEASSDAQGRGVWRELTALHEAVSRQQQVHGRQPQPQLGGVPGMFSFSGGLAGTTQGKLMFVWCVGLGATRTHASADEALMLSLHDADELLPVTVHVEASGASVRQEQGFGQGSMPSKDANDEMTAPLGNDDADSDNSGNDGRGGVRGRRQRRRGAGGRQRRGGGSVDVAVVPQVPALFGSCIVYEARHELGLRLQGHIWHDAFISDTMNAHVVRLREDRPAGDTAVLVSTSAIAVQRLLFALDTHNATTAAAASAAVPGRRGDDLFETPNFRTQRR